jgi:hypothetical protein
MTAYGFFMVNARPQLVDMTRLTLIENSVRTNAVLFTDNYSCTTCNCRVKQCERPRRLSPDEQALETLQKTTNRTIIRLWQRAQIYICVYVPGMLLDLLAFSSPFQTKLG